jgi:hypothetical protein
LTIAASQTAQLPEESASPVALLASEFIHHYETSNQLTNHPCILPFQKVASPDSDSTHQPQFTNYNTTNNHPQDITPTSCQPRTPL